MTQDGFLKIGFTTVVVYYASNSIGSMYGMYGNIYHQYTPNVSIYTIHGSIMGMDKHSSFNYHGIFHRIIMGLEYGIRMGFPCLCLYPVIKYNTGKSEILHQCGFPVAMFVSRRISRGFPCIAGLFRYNWSITMVKLTDDSCNAHPSSTSLTFSIGFVFAQATTTAFYVHVLQKPIALFYGIPR